jgi:hypothetical protein
MAKIGTFITYLIPYTLLLYLLNKLIISRFFYDFKLETNIVSIYLFLFTATMFIYFFLVFVNKKYPEKTGFAFLTTGLLKMMASVVFLLPLIQSKKIVVNDVIAFFVPYFLFLIFETIFAVRLINKS